MLPESIIKNELVLPRGAVCDVCNQYLGKLDSAIAHHRDISVALQAFGFPGKAGKPRMKLGWLERVGSPDSLKVEIKGKAMQKIEIKGGGISVDLYDPPSWDYRKFNRGIYHIAFNFLAHCISPESLLDERFDPARRYIRSPKRGEVWSYSAATIRNTPIRTINLCWLRDAPGVNIGVQLFHYAYAVDLLQVGGLTEWLEANGPPPLAWTTTCGRTGIHVRSVNPTDQSDS